MHKRKDDVVQYSGPNDVFVWKHPRENFTTNTWLEVQESQEAILFHNGQALDLLPSGLYLLEEHKIPLLTKVLGYAPGKPISFHAAIYFFNMSVNMDLLWGTAPPIPLEDPKYQINGQGITVHVCANGQFSISIADSRKLCVKLVGTMSSLTRSDVERYFKGIVNNRVKTIISDTMIRDIISVREVARKQIQISDEIKMHLIPVFAEYGLALREFSVSAICPQSDDPGMKTINEALARGYASVIEANAQATVSKTTASIDVQMQAIKCFKTGGRCNRDNIVYNSKRIFIGCPFHEEYLNMVESVIRPVCEELGYSMWIASDYIMSNDIMCKVCGGIQSFSKAIVDISDINPNVLFELGLLYGLGKEVVLIRQINTAIPIPVDLYGMEYIPYSLHDFKRVKEKIKAYLQERISDVG